jgi:hypothetical protein
VRDQLWIYLGVQGFFSGGPLGAATAIATGPRVSLWAVVPVNLLVGDLGEAGGSSAEREIKFLNHRFALEGDAHA